MTSLIFLIGYRGSGKTTVGRLLASRLGWQFIDADAIIEERACKTIREIFANEGEQFFRDREAAILTELCKRTDTVIATGGGVVLRPENRTLLRQYGFVAWLTADAATLWQRIQADASTAARRPALTTGGLEEVRQLLALREPFYRETADVEVSVDVVSPEQASDTILAAWTSRSQKSSG
jgi:shikimate kinase